MVIVSCTTIITATNTQKILSSPSELDSLLSDSSSELEHFLRRRGFFVFPIVFFFFSFTSSFDLALATLTFLFSMSSLLNAKTSASKQFACR